MKKRLISLLLAVGMMLSLFPVSAFAEAGTGTVVKKVSSAADFQAAVEEINRDGGNYTISLQDNIDLPSSEDLTLTRGETTILGNGHTLSGGDTQTLGVSGNAVLNLGSETVSDTLTLDGKRTGSITAVRVSGSATLNLYNGVTIENYTDSGVKVDTGAAFNMAGGTIQKCVGSVGGGVYVADGTFTMAGGTISHCKASSPFLGGGGVAIAAFVSGSKLTLNGGRILDNSAEQGFGGGILIYDKCDVSSVQNMTITGNTALKGGGICLVSRNSNLAIIFVDMSGSTNVLCNNTAAVYENVEAYGDDVFLSSTGDSIQLPAAAGMNQNYGTTSHKIDGWYAEQADSRYTPIENGEAQDVSGTLSGPLALVASYKRVRHNITMPDPNTYTADAKNEKKEIITSSLEDEKVYLSYDPNALQEGETFEKWTVTDGNGKLVKVEHDANGAYFVMPESNVTVALDIRSAGEEPVAPTEPSGPADVTGSIVAGAALGAAGYYAGTGLYLNAVFGYVPANRQALASALWEKAGKPEPQSMALYTDVDEQDADAQRADRWCVEQGLLPDKGKDTFKPAGWVTHTRCIVSWKKLEKMLKGSAA